jgi:hypothetical protein
MNSPGQDEAAGPETVVQRVDRLDVRLFDKILVGGSSREDRRSLLALHSAVAQRGPFSYLEVGPYLGGTLQALVADPRCTSVVAIDRRDETSPDERPERPLYLENTTGHMMELLDHVPYADVTKVRPVDASTEMLDPENFTADLCFIDGEHTNDAALRDARFCRRVIRDCGVIAFHDRTLVARALRSFLAELDVSHRAYPLKHEIFVVEIGPVSLLGQAAVRSQLPRRAWLLLSRLKLIRPALALTSRAR